MRTLLMLVAFLAAGCRTPEQRAARQQQRYDEAQQLFEQVVKQYHLPSAEAQGAEQATLLDQAAAGYEQVLRQYRDQAVWCAQALRSLGNVRAAQGNLDQAVRLYDRVARDYPADDWEVIQAWKSAADLLEEAGRTAEARVFSQKIVTRFDGDDQPAVVKTVVRASKARLAGP